MNDDERIRADLKRALAIINGLNTTARKFSEHNVALRADLNRALDALTEGVALWHDEQRYVSGERVGRFLSEARAVLAAHDRETPGGRMSELRSEVLDHFRSTAGADHDREAQT